MRDKVPSSHSSARGAQLNRAEMGRKNFALLLVSLVVITAVLVVALSQGRPDTIGTAYEVFQAHRNTWASRRPANYAVNVDRRCFCPLWFVRVTVAGAEVSDVKFLNTPNDPSLFSDRRRYPRDIDTLFEIIDAAYMSRAYRIELTFDETYGYPVRVLIDGDRDAVDDEKTFVLSAFTPSHVG